ncbi:MAG: alpha/beta hydrolase [Proteobacteria bacterium ST_bin13]|nr:MAG: alpha/beta hydrolase [Proteobacteria bacterium ST_bin13]
MLAAATMMLSGPPAVAAPVARRVSAHATAYRTVEVDGVRVFYREAGPRDAPTILLLHGFPSSSRMFDTLIPLLADRYHLVAPDYPGFGNSDAPPANHFAYTFDHIATLIDRFTEKVGVHRYALYMNDYGGPIGFRLAIAHPDRVTALIVQNAVAHEDGLGPAWEPRKAFWRDRSAHEADIRKGFLSLQTTKLRHLGSSPAPERYDPDLWNDEYAFLQRPGEADIQTDLFYDYRTNVAAYPRWSAWLREHRPPLLALWGRYDPFFALAEVDAYKRDVPEAEIHLLDGGHFALDETVDESATLIRRFLTRHSMRR